MHWLASAFILAAIMVGFFIFTFNPPNIPLYIESQEGAKAAATDQRGQIEIEYPEFRILKARAALPGSQ